MSEPTPTPPQPITLRPATLADTPRMIAVGSAAFGLDNAISTLLFPASLTPDPAARHAAKLTWREARLVSGLSNPKRQHIVAVAPDGDVVGSAGWEVKDDDAGEASGGGEMMTPEKLAKAKAAPGGEALDLDAMVWLGRTFEKEAVRVLGPKGDAGMWCESFAPLRPPFPLPYALAGTIVFSWPNATQRCSVYLWIPTTSAKASVGCCWTGAWSRRGRRAKTSISCRCRRDGRCISAPGSRRLASLRCWDS
jgi:hypothetical protein